jgi:dihydroorotase
LSLLDNPNNIAVPAFTDVHVHFREPGFSYKETIASGSLAAAASGYSHVFAMPNLNPVPDSRESLQAELDIIKRDACINVIPYAAITCGEKGKELSDMETLAGMGICAFSDDGVGLNDVGLMREAMLRAKALGKVIAAHCEDLELRAGGYIHDGAYAKAHGHKGISSASEWKPIERDLKLAAETGAAYHVCHISTKESVEVIRQAKKSGVNVTCETAPHYLVLCDEDLQEDGRFKMNPPIRSREDRKALLEGICDGTIDMIATDHAPHSAEEKGKGLEGSAMGIVGLETAFPVLYTELVKGGVIKMEKLVELMSTNPRRRFGLRPVGGPAADSEPAPGASAGNNPALGAAGRETACATSSETACPTGRESACTASSLADCDFAIWDIGTEYAIDPETFKSMGRATPFAGRKVYGRCLATFVGGHPVFTR